jgi:hypothetical protein
MLGQRRTDALSTLGTPSNRFCAQQRVLAESIHDPISSTPSSVRGLLAAQGEDVVAYEILCDNLYEIDARPPAGFGRELRQAVADAGADPSRADLLLG